MPATTLQTAKTSKNKTAKSTFRKLTGKLHLWLGLSTGLIVFIVAITGCIYAFQVEIQDLTQPFRFVTPQAKAFLTPTQIREISDKALPGKHIHSVLYQGNSRAAKAIYFSAEEDNRYYDFVYVNQYTGQVLKVKDEYADFFRLVLDGHFYLWLPHDIGQPVVASATLVFLVMVVSGIILWWPKNKNGAKQRFSIKWNARWRRKNYDLHNVLGFYISWLALLFALTGLVWGFQWFAGGVYGLASGGKTYLPYEEPISLKPETLSVAGMPVADKIWHKMLQEHLQAETYEIHFPETEASPILAAMNSDAKTYWKLDYRFFDQYTLKELPVTHQWGRLEQATGADKLMRMNYDIHVGAILGLPGKFLAFFASLLIASLPVTGFMIWWGRRNKAKKGELVF